MHLQMQEVYNHFIMQKYQKDLDYSYTLGIYPTIELLKAKPEAATRIFTHSKLTDKNGSQMVKGLAARNNITIEQNDRLIEKLSPKENCYAVGVFDKYQLKLGINNHLVLNGIRNFGNLGTITRSMLAFDFYDLAIIQPAVDIFHPSVVRASMGAIFSLNFEYFNKLEDYKKKYRNHNFYLFMTDGKNELSQTNFAKPFSLIFGNESSGLPKSYKQLGETVKINQSSKVDSLNLAVSAGIVMHSCYEKNY